MRPVGLFLFACVFTAELWVPSRSWADWSVVRKSRAQGKIFCVLESERQPIFDGYQDSSVFVVVSEGGIIVKSESCLDSEFQDVGFIVDDKRLLKMDEVHDRRTGVFKHSYDQIIEALQGGSELNVQLRFWPEWPTTGVHRATFSLRGFPEAYAEVGNCRPTSPPGEAH